MIADRGPFAYAGQPENHDAEILALFHEWLDVCRILDETLDYEGDADKEARWNAAAGRQCEIEDRIFAYHGGPVGLAVKTFLDIYRDVANWAPCAHQLRLNDDQDRPGWMESLLRDAAALVPEIGECAAAVIHDDAVLIEAEMQVDWSREYLSEPAGPHERPEHRADVEGGPILGHSAAIGCRLRAPMVAKAEGF
jgi:hypothetical protein